MADLVKSLVRAQGILLDAGIESAVIGAMALAVRGEPRYTKDVDIKVLLGRDEAARLLDAIPSDYRPIGGDPLEMLHLAGMIFFIDPDGIRMDLLLADTAFDHDVIRRATSVELAPGFVARICTAEDLVIYKMISTREKDHADLASIIKRQGSRLDQEYIVRWLREFEIALDDSTMVAEFERRIHRTR